MLKMKGIKKVCSMSQTLKGPGSKEYVEVFYNTKTSQIWEIHHFWGGFRYSYDDPDIIRVGKIVSPCTMRDLRDFTQDALENRELPCHKA